MYFKILSLITVAAKKDMCNIIYSIIIYVILPTSLSFSMASLVTQLVKNLPAMQETPVRFLGWEDPLEKREVTHSSILAWRIPWTG